MIIVKGAKDNTPGMTTDDIIKMALGSEDQYGNPFEIIELRWNSTPMHRATGRQKTMGFEDTLISFSNALDSFRIVYRKPGSAIWFQKIANRGPYFSSVAKTPYNMRKLATHYDYKLWRFTDFAIEAEVSALWETMKAEWTEEQVLRHETILRMMHSRKAEQTIPGAVDIPARVTEKDLKETERQLRLRESELKKKEAAFNARERKRLQDSVKNIKETKATPVGYTREALEQMKRHELQRVCRENKITTENTDKNVDLVDRISRHFNPPVPGNEVSSQVPVETVT